MIYTTQAAPKKVSQIVNNGGKNTPIIIAPSQMVLENEGFQRKLRDAINGVYIELRQDYRKGHAVLNSSRKYQSFIEGTIYDYPGDIYSCDEQGRFHKLVTPDLSAVWGYDARFLRDFMRQHRQRRDFYKLLWLAIFIGVHKPLSYEGLITI